MNLFSFYSSTVVVRKARKNSGLSKYYSGSAKNCKDHTHQKTSDSELTAQITDKPCKMPSNADTLKE